MKERVIYTSIVGGFDALMQPEVTDPRYDYVCFVRKGEAGAGRAGLWQLREIPVDIPDPRRLSRYPKMHPSELLPGYRWSLWMDGNLQIVSELFYRRVDEIIESGVEMAGCRFSRQGRVRSGRTYDKIPALQRLSSPRRALRKRPAPPGLRVGSGAAPGCYVVGVPWLAFRPGPAVADVLRQGVRGADCTVSAGGQEHPGLGCACLCLSRP